MGEKKLLSSAFYPEVLFLRLKPDVNLIRSRRVDVLSAASLGSYRKKKVNGWTSAYSKLIRAYSAAI